MKYSLCSKLHIGYTCSIRIPSRNLDISKKLKFTLKDEMLQMIRHGAAKIFTDELQERVSLISFKILKILM